MDLNTLNALAELLKAGFNLNMLGQFSSYDNVLNFMIVDQADNTRITYSVLMSAEYL